MFLQFTKRNGESVSVNVNQINYFVGLSDGSTRIYFGATSDGHQSIVVSDTYKEVMVRLRDL